MTLHLPPDGLRVLLPSVAAETPEDEAEAEAEQLVDPAPAAPPAMHEHREG